MNTPAPSRRGSALIPFAIFTVALLGMAALAIDLGQANLTRRQMQAATDAAALEGVRWQDRIADRERRVIASQAAARVFDFDGDLTTEDDMLGAGPLISIDGGTGDRDASGLLTIGDTAAGTTRRLYTQRTNLGGGRTGWLALNTPNARAGDLVAGVYRPDSPHADGQFRGSRWVPYARPDFSSDRRANDFLARMRRTTADQSARPPTSTAGPPLPWLFARGSTLRPAPGRSLADGIDVRTTSIARQDIARTVGPQILDASIALADGSTIAGLVGFAPFAIRADLLATAPVGTIIPVEVTPLGTLRLRNTPPTTPSNTDAGFAISSTFLTAPIDAAQTTIPAAAVDPRTLGPLPARVRIAGEGIRILAADPAGTLTVERGIEGTTPAAHPAGRRITRAEPITIGMPAEPMRTRFDTPQPTFTLLNTEIDIAPPAGNRPEFRARFIVPVYDEVAALPGVPLIIGFVSADIRRDQERPERFRIIKTEPVMHPLNASATITADWLTPLEAETGPLTDAQRRSIAAEVAARTLDPTFIAPAPAPALVRSY